MKRIKEIDESEYDVFSGWRRVMCYTQRAGVCKRIKRQYNRRFRRASKRYALREAMDT